MKLALARVGAAGLLAAGVFVATAAPAYADELTFSGCADASVAEPLAGATVCAFDSATIGYDSDPIHESGSCAYGPSVVVDPTTISVDGIGVDVYYTVLGSTHGGTVYEPPVWVDGRITPGYDSGPLWTIPC